MKSYEDWFFNRVVPRIVKKIETKARVLTPVKTGEARDGWYSGVNTPDDEIVGFVRNDVPHMVQLDMGSSKQAPAGVTPQLHNGMQSIVDEAISETGTSQ